MTDWQSIIERVSPYIVKIETQSGSGTGFLCGHNQDKTISCIATAYHVINHADSWKQPIKIYSDNLNHMSFIKDRDRVIFSDPKTDSAVILAHTNQFVFPEGLIPLRPIVSPISIGGPVGWLGYPGIALNTLCFFDGTISARASDSAYYIDGVAINGVSGGPVMYADSTNGVEFIGSVSAYHANRLTGETLPGLLIAQDVTHFHDVIQKMKSLAEAKEQRENQTTVTDNNSIPA